MWDVSKCDECGDCLLMCQYVDYNREKAIRNIAELIDGREAQILWDCITCTACNDYCTKGANPFDLICDCQEEKGVAVASQSRSVAILKLIESVPSEVIKGDPGKPVLCIASEELFFPEGVFESQIFDGLTLAKGLDYFEYYFLLRFAQESITRRNAQKVVDNLAILGADEIVTVFDDSYAGLCKAREYGIKLPFKLTHIVEYLLRYMRGRENSITKLDKKIAFHIPCAMRHSLSFLPEIDDMLDALFELIGVERIERRFDRKNALCCRGQLLSKNPGKFAKLQDMNLTDAIICGADAMVSTCPGCLIYLTPLSKERGLPLILTADLCRMALGEKPFPSVPGPAKTSPDLK
ncbi:hypothetical protein ES703_41920 [subsurface metagenome]